MNNKTLLIALLVIMFSFSHTVTIPLAEEQLPPLTESWGPLPGVSETLPPLPDLQEEAAVRTVWTCSMHPNIQLPEFGQCPICFMDLIEVALDDNTNLSSLRQISFNDQARKLAQVEVTAATRGTAPVRISMVGKIDYDETRVNSITAWISGRIDKLHAAYTGSQVRAGQPMAEMYSPDLLTAQAELIEAEAAAKRIQGSGNSLLENTIKKTRTAARKKLRLFGLSDEQIDQVVTQGSPADHITLTAPISGIVIQKNVTEGVYVKTGTPIYTIADLSRLWVVLEAYETDLHAITLGQQVEFTAEALPGIRFAEKIAYIDPLVDNTTRTVRVRLNVDNTDQKLKPGMFIRAVAISGQTNGKTKKPLLIPATAPLFTGKRAIVYVQVPDQEGVYVGHEITLGPRRGEFYEVTGGLQEGELVVSRGNFKIDSAIQIQARPSMMNPFMVRETTELAPLPSLFSSKLTLLNESFINLSKEIHAGDLTSQEYALNGFSELLAAIDSDFLDSDIRLDWNELSMLLTSDTILLGEADDADELNRLYADMATHFYQVRTRFRLNGQIAVRPGTDELRKSLGDLLDAYLALQKNLADDALQRALAGIAGISSAADNFAEELQRFDAQTATTLSPELKSAMQALSTSADMEEIRAAFYPLSKILIDAVATYGAPGAYPIFVHYCPMAFDDTGAKWLDTSETISNPYYGDLMLRCGEVQQQLKLSKPDDPS